MSASYAEDWRFDSSLRNMKIGLVTKEGELKTLMWFLDIGPEIRIHKDQLPSWDIAGRPAELFMTTTRRTNPVNFEEPMAEGMRRFIVASPVYTKDDGSDDVVYYREI